MSTTTTAVHEIPKLGHAEAMRLAGIEYARMAELLRTLSDDDWDLPTDCDRWTVKGIVSHIVGITQGVLNPLEMRRQARAGRRLSTELGLSKFDAGNEVQVVEREHLTGSQVRAAFDAIVPRILRRRTRFPAPMRALPIPDGSGGRMRLGYLLDVVLTRDIWMHRVDISRATGRELVLTPEHDGRLVARVVADWARKHGRPFTLRLTGPAGGTYAHGNGGQEYALDAAEFCRTLSGRAEGTGLLETKVLF